MHKLITSILVAFILVGPARANGMLAVAPVPPDQQSPFGGSAEQSRSEAQQLEDAVRSELGRAGLTDVHLMIVVRARDADGNPVAFLLSPNAVAGADGDPQEAPPGTKPGSIPGEEKF